MTTSVDDVTLRRITQAAQELTDTKATLELLTQRKTELEEFLRQALGAGIKNFTAGNHTITIAQPTRRLNTTLIARTYPVTEFPSLYKAQIDTAAVKKALSENELEAAGLYTLSAPTVKVD